jgi:hypothetical protein
MGVCALPHHSLLSPDVYGFLRILRLMDLDVSIRTFLGENKIYMAELRAYTILEASKHYDCEACLQ